MANGDLLWDVIGLGFLGLGAYSAYVYKDEILAWLDGLDGGQQGCTKTCQTGQHLVTSTCTCVPNTCTKTCQTGQHIDSSCNCVPNTICGGKTCGSGTHLNTATCNCDSDGGSTGGNITFCAAGDWGSGRNNNWSATTATMKSQHPNVVLIPGDMSYSDAPAFKKVTDAIKAFPAQVFGAKGNHDTGSGYNSLFNAYSNFVKTVGNVSFMGLDTENSSGSVSFARANLSKMTAKFKVVFFHKPIWTVKSDHPPDEGKIKALIPDFEAAHVNMVIQGHNHNYQRFAPKNGVTYLVVGTGGEGAYSIGANCSGCPAIVKTTGSFGCLAVATSNAAMNCRFIKNGGSVFDSWTI